MAQEYDDRPGILRDRLVASQREWRTYLRGLLLAGVAHCRISAHLDDEQAVFDLMSAALAFQHGSRLLGDARAKAMALEVLDRIAAKP